MVPGEGIEPSLCRQNWILSPARLPIPPSRPDCVADAATASPCDHADYRSNATVLQTPRNAFKAMAERVYCLSDFDFHLPPELIAQRPAATRSASRLLHVSGNALRDLDFGALPDLLDAGDLLVLNDTRVIRSRLVGRKSSGGRVELLLERIVSDDEAWMQLRASHPPRVGGEVELPAGAIATVLERDGRFFFVRIDAGMPLVEYLERFGEVPLPPYIARPADAGDA